MRRIFFALAAVAGAWAVSAGDSIVLVRNGRPAAEIVVASDATKAARFGARELAAHVKAMTGADLPCVTPEKHDRSKSAVYIGFSAPVEALGFRAGSCGPQQYVLACRGNAVVLAGHDKPDAGGFKLEYGNDVNDVALEGHPNAFTWPQIFEERGSLNAVYDFLRDECGVTWADPTDTGTVLKRSRDLVIRRFDDRHCEPFVRCRASGLRWGYKPEIWRPDTRGWTNYMRVAYARAFARRFPQLNIETQKRLFLLRMKVGGELIVANHSFYPWYERFWQKDSPNFESYHPEYFAQGLGKGKSSGKEIAGGYDASEKPPQLCYSNPSVVSQAVADIRAYFDEGGYKKRFSTINAPGMHWGENNHAVEPMDNHGFCRCPDCVRQYHPERSADRGEQSDYIFRFVKSVADEVAKTHPDKRLSTLAYMSREGVPREVRLPDNVMVHFTFHGNRMPNDPLLAQQEQLLRNWRTEYPKNDFGVWLYDCFPEYMAYRRGFNCFPGFFSKLLASEYAFLKEMNVRACIFYDGMTDDFENYLSFAWMWDPDVPLKALKDRYFASFGAAEKPIRAYYDLVESRFCDKALYAGRTGHQTREMAWKILGDDETMTKLRGLVVAAAKAPGLTERERRRVHQWKAGYWDYMYSGKHTPTPLPSDRPGVTIVKTEHLWTKAPPSFGPSVLAGVPTEIVQSDPRNYLVSPETGNRLQARTSTSVLTDGDLETTFFIDSKAPVAKYILRKPIKGLAKVRLQVTTRDPARARFRLRLVGIVAGKEQPLSPWIEQKTWYGPDKTREPGLENWTTYDFSFAPGSAPAKIEALGIEDETPSLGAYWPRLMEIEAR